MLELIKYYRLSNGLDSKRFALMVGCSASQMSKIERGLCEPKLDLTLRILRLVVPGFNNAYLEAEAGCELYMLEYKKGRDNGYGI